MTLRIPSQAAAAATVFALVACLGPCGRWPAPASAGVSQTASPCVLQLEKVADPSVVRLGENTTVTLAIASDCPSRPVPLHVVLTTDASTSMTSGGKLEAARQAAIRFVESIDLSSSAVGIVSFNSNPTVRTELTSDRSVAIAAIQAIDTGRGTDIAAAIDSSREVLARGRGTTAPDPIEILVVMSDGRQTQSSSGGSAALLAAAERAKAEGNLVATICFGTDCQAEVMRQAASRADLYFGADSADSLIAIYELLAGQLERTTLRSLTVIDRLPSNMSYEPGSASPPPVETGPDWLKWTWILVPATSVTITFNIEPQEPGRWPTNTEAEADFRDTDDLEGSGLFPVPEVEVVAPTPTCTTTPIPSPTSTATPTASPTATATATPTPEPTATATARPKPAYLPLVLREQCVPQVRRVDAVLVLDASSSMAEQTSAGRSKLRAAQAACLRFIYSLRLGSGDKVALVTFNSAASVAQPLTSDYRALERSLAAVALDQQTRLDLGVRAGLTELAGARHRLSSVPVMVILTDGLANPVPPEAALAEARIAKAMGQVLFTVGVGDELAASALAAMATEPDYFYRTGDGEDLPDIFAEIAETIPCPASAFWGRR